MFRLDSGVVLRLIRYDLNIRGVAIWVRRTGSSLRWCNKLQEDVEGISFYPMVFENVNGLYVKRCGPNVDRDHFVVDRCFDVANTASHSKSKGRYFFCVHRGRDYVLSF